MSSPPARTTLHSRPMDEAQNSPSASTQGPEPADGKTGSWPAFLVADLRTDHAGEAGAVMIYRGMLAVSRDVNVRRFARAHLAAEQGHCAQIELLLPPAQRSRLLPLWRIAGWLTGALPAMFGPRAVYATIQSVETFVDQHYAEQLSAIDRHDPQRRDSPLQLLRAVLHSFRDDEIEHRDEAAALLSGCGRPAGAALRLWTQVVATGSRLAVKVSHRI